MVISRKISTLALVSAGLLVASLLFPGLAKADGTTVTLTLSQLPVTATIPQPADETTSEPEVNITITDAAWLNAVTFVFSDGPNRDTPNTTSDIVSFFNNNLGQAVLCGESDPILATYVCPVENTIISVTEGSGEALLAAQPFSAKDLNTGGAIVLLVDACGGGRGCTAKGFGDGLSDGVHISLVPSSVPEPATLALLGTGMLAMGLRGRRRLKG